MTSLSLPIVLVGLPGAGKTKVGRLAAQSLGVAHIDTDRLIEEEAGCSISTIFAQEGEAGFREREAQAVERALKMKAIISLGGGAVIGGQCHGFNLPVVGFALLAQPEQYPIRVLSQQWTVVLLRDPA